MYYCSCSYGLNPSIPTYQSLYTNGNKSSSPYLINSNHQKDTFKSTAINKDKSNKNNNIKDNKTLKILGKVALAILGAAAIYKGHNIISKGVGKVGKAAHAYKNSHANFSLKGLGHAGKEIGSSIGKAATSVVKVPCKLLSETAKIFKKTVK